MSRGWPSTLAEPVQRLRASAATLFPTSRGMPDSWQDWPVSQLDDLPFASERRQLSQQRLSMDNRVGYLADVSQIGSATSSEHAQRRQALADFSILAG